MRVIGIDIGYGHTKVVADGHPLIFPSLVGPAKEINFTLGKKDSPGDVVEWDGKRFFVGEKARHSDTIDFLRSREWIKDSIYAALLISAIKRVVGEESTGEEAVIVTGLPVDYMKDSVVAVDVVRKVCDLLSINIVELKIIPQPIGSFFDILLDDAGNRRADAPYLIKKLGLVDVGYNTTDYILLENCQESIERAAGSVSKGAHDTYSLVARELKSRFNRDEVPIRDAEDAVRTRFFRSGGINNDVSLLVNDVLSQVGSSIAKLIASKWAIEGEIDKVLLTGGGGVLLRQYLSRISPSLEMVQAPQIANARGYFKRATALVNVLAGK